MQLCLWHYGLSEKQPECSWASVSVTENEDTGLDQWLSILVYIRITWKVCSNTDGYAGLTPRFKRSGRGLRICIYDKFPGDADAVGSGTTFLSTTRLDTAPAGSTFLWFYARDC